MTHSYCCSYNYYNLQNRYSYDMRWHVVAMLITSMMASASSLSRIALRSPILRRGGVRLAAMSSTPSSVLNFAQATPTDGSASLSFVPLDAAALAAAPQLVVVGKGSELAATVGGLGLSASTDLMAALVGSDQAKAGDAGKVVTTWLSGGSGLPLQHLSLVLLPEAASRHNHPARPDAVPKLLKSAMSAAGSSGPVSVVVALSDASHRHALSCAVAKALPLVSFASSSSPKPSRAIGVSFATPSGGSVTWPGSTTSQEGDEAAALHASNTAAAAVRKAAAYVDLPPAVCGVDRMVREAEAAVARLRGSGAAVTSRVVRGEELRDLGYGGLWGVGQAAEEAPALVVLSYDPAQGEGGGVATANPESVAWVGKGIVYDTGGLSLKVGGGMVGMKSDMAASAAMLAAFEAAVVLKSPQKLHLVLCLAENAIGPKAMRNDDILRLLSGKTVEINNTDAEGRLVLGDGVALASKSSKNNGDDNSDRLPGPPVNLIVDMATLTGAQLVTTGKTVAAVMSNGEEAEKMAVAAGRHSGDLLFPILYAPELLRAEFKSEVADMKNSVKDRGNAQASCAGTFIGEHLAKDFTGDWVHVDMAGPAWANDRGTGFGVAWLLSLAQVA